MSVWLGITIFSVITPRNQTYVPPTDTFSCTNINWLRLTLHKSAQQNSRRFKKSNCVNLKVMTLCRRPLANLQKFGRANVSCGKICETWLIHTWMGHDSFIYEWAHPCVTWQDMWDTTHSYMNATRRIHVWATRRSLREIGRVGWCTGFGRRIRSKADARALDPKILPVNASVKILFFY